MFWSLIGLELVILFSTLIWVMNLTTPAPASFASTGRITPVEQAIMARLSGSVNDPLIEIKPGISVRESNLRGFHLDGSTYYYYIEGQNNFDPLSAGSVSNRDIEIVLRNESGPHALVIYTVRDHNTTF